ncbi:MULTISPECIES: sugar ABC transporter ATP-binding protein [unclassified Rhizobium]|uniref:sugar ABC transporter ATP-binding protein n=1 Tax=unclassified Rhizobium TaxID=2613769 RepID=UPI001ADABDE9|nr:MULTISPECIES: sugar ABC transporter ATP-binding protein [unclassified Rhizobium]MBO9100703.1 sugar ABC transporter ATP-binding protein [Rhizobium sp. L58/93]MBO9135936.1 sugar ABC transporter ATP-binding protein [Rhizobium sp. B209b/85]MBO9171247.1 sugar ABC transporter ATP-binding protein [Rhizobium sp. L245/93]MBO9187114.1 sugar ABC transporter ATP-binding protein [Rhizobium sp. E27B/91]QXZ88084.1 sugar ABC transporter ATP-binding protein [Rhizobium sp. K1/93]
MTAALQYPVVDSPPAPETAILEMRGISQIFPGVKALDNVSIALYPGKVTALIGENGAGKSTLVKILTGIYRPNEGEILVDGKPTTFSSAQASIDAGVTAIHQETVLFDELTVAENIFLGHAPRTAWRTIDWKTMNSSAKALLVSLESAIDPTIRLKDLSIAQRHLVAIARALSIEARIVIMDEPTAALSRKEIDDLFRIVEGLKAQGKAILFISHKFDEVYEIADNFAVFRDGRAVGHGRLKDTPQDEIVRIMVGRDVKDAFPKMAVDIGATVLAVERYCHATEFRDISFELRRGEILGIYGLIGAGRSELCQSLFGITKPLSGKLTLDGKEITIRSPLDAIRAGIVYVPEERGRHGLALPMPIFQNMSLPSLVRTSRKGFLNAASELALARKYAERLDLRAAALSVPVGTLSGGNQQKVVIGKWLATLPKVIILDEPTKGIDIGSKAAVHQFISELAAEGLSIIMISSELPEIIGMADRVLVMKEGLSAGLFDRDALTPETLVRAATGNV